MFLYLLNENQKSAFFDVATALCLLISALLIEKFDISTI